jgi:glycosyltransferase involved in cell wall biosynthesis
MDDIQQRAKELDGVTDHGKVGQDELVRHMFESGVWAYPCPFPEIYAITAVKAQAAGCIPVTTDFAALNETVQFGTKVHLDPLLGVAAVDNKFLSNYKKSLIDTLLAPEKQESQRRKMMKWARTNSWETVSKDWDYEFQS